MQIVDGFKGKTLLCIAHRLKTSKFGSGNVDYCK